ncbi:MAG: hypothetical protein KF900_09950 [Bacteroidetes bacterium]|nr:hypothetical protein [Bacteroidota bacterium]
MKNTKDMLDDYDFSKGKRGKYAKQYAAGTNLIALEPDVAKIYKDAEIINETLRAVAKIAFRKKKHAA